MSANSAVKISDNVFHSGYVKSNFTFTPANNELYHLKSAIKLITQQGTTIQNFSQTYSAWPAFCTVKETPWPTDGEIDIIEIYWRNENGMHTVTILLDDKIVACFKNSSISNFQLQAFKSHSTIFYSI